MAEFIFHFAKQIARCLVDLRLVCDVYHQAPEYSLIGEKRGSKHLRIDLAFLLVGVSRILRHGFELYRWE